MLLQRYRTNNGYRCECCRQMEYDAVWIKREKMVPFYALVESAYSKPTEGFVFLQYEDNGEILYGFRAEFTKKKYEAYVIIAGKEYCILAEGSDRAYITKEELDELYWQHIEKFLNDISDELK